MERKQSLEKVLITLPWIKVSGELCCFLWNQDTRKILLLNEDSFAKETKTNDVIDEKWFATFRSLHTFMYFDSIISFIALHVDRVRGLSHKHCNNLYDKFCFVWRKTCSCCGVLLPLSLGSFVTFSSKSRVFFFFLTFYLSIVPMWNAFNAKFLLYSDYFTFCLLTCLSGELKRKPRDSPNTFYIHDDPLCYWISYDVKQVIILNTWF